MARKITKIKLYQNLSAKQLDNFLKQFGTRLNDTQLIEIKNKEQDMFGDFIVSNGYKFKLACGTYQCLETPTEKHKPQKATNIKQAFNDNYKNWKNRR